MAGRERSGGTASYLAFNRFTDLPTRKVNRLDYNSRSGVGKSKNLAFMWSVASWAQATKLD